MHAADKLLLLTAIESNARVARESLANGLLIQNQPDPIVMPGQPPRPPNRTVAATLFQQHGQAMDRMRAVCVALITGGEQQQQPEQSGSDTDPIAGRIGERLNGTGEHP